MAFSRLSRAHPKRTPRFTGKVISEITSADISDWLKELRLAPVSKNRHRPYAHQLFEAATDRGVAGINPVMTVKKFYDPSEEEEVVVLAPKQLTSLMETAAPEIRPVLATVAYAGVRFAEISGMSWEDIKFEEGFNLGRQI